MTEPDRHLTPRRPIGIEDWAWDLLGRTVGPRNRSKVIRQLVLWWLRVPGAKLPPDRPATPPQ